MDFTRTFLEVIDFFRNRAVASRISAKFRIGEQIYFMRYDIIHCGFVTHIFLDDQNDFSYETDLVDVLAESDTEDFVNLTVSEEDAFETLDELIERLKENQIISIFL